LIVARDLKLPEGVHLAIPPETPIANSVLVKVEVEPTVAAAPTAEGTVAATPAAGAPAAPAEAPAKGASPEKGKDKK
jgi:hypothetical protein